MNNCRKILPIVFFLIAALFPGKNLLSQDHKSKIVEIARRSKVDPVKIGISIRDFTKKDEIVSINSDRMFNPASNIKILTSYCALKELGPNYRWKTTLLSNTSSQNGEIDNLIIKGNGDPYMVSESLWLLAKELINRGILKVKGDLIIDSSDFNWDKKLSEFKASFDRSFTAIPSAVSLNFNSVTILVYPQKKGEPPKVIVDPAVDYITLKNRAKTVTSKKYASPKLSIRKLKNKTEIQVYGNWALNSKTTHYRKIFHPELYFASAFRTFYTQLGGTIHGKTKLEKTGENFVKILDFKSRPLSQSVFGLNKFSNNFIASQLLLTMGVAGGGFPATYDKGIDSLNKCFSSMGIAKKDNVINSASGLSRETRITPSQLTYILKEARRDFSVYPEFASSLSIFGEDGTVKGRDSIGEQKGVVRVKTGSLDSIDSLSGYIQTKVGNELAFSIISNDFKEPQRNHYKDFQDKVISYIFSNL